MWIKLNYKRYFMHTSSKFSCVVRWQYWQQAHPKLWKMPSCEFFLRKKSSVRNDLAIWSIKKGNELACATLKKCLIIGSIQWRSCYWSRKFYFNLFDIFFNMYLQCHSHVSLLLLCYYEKYNKIVFSKTKKKTYIYIIIFGKENQYLFEFLLVRPNPNLYILF